MCVRVCAFPPCLEVATATQNGKVEASVAETALRELQGERRSPNTTSSTLIITSVHRVSLDDESDAAVAAIAGSPV